MSEDQVAELKSSLADMITGVESPVPQTSSSSNGSASAVEDDITPFPSPMLSATSLAGLSLGSDGELELEVDLEREVSEEDGKRALEIKAQANKAFAGALIDTWQYLWPVCKARVPLQRYQKPSW